MVIAYAVWLWLYCYSIESQAPNWLRWNRRLPQHSEDIDTFYWGEGERERERERVWVRMSEWFYLLKDNNNNIIAVTNTEGNLSIVSTLLIVINL